MEYQTHFDLTGAIESWRTELVAQTSLDADTRRELETHLRDTIAGFQQRGLNDEESFWLARRRMGQPPQLVEEFAKADPVKFWRERGLWMAVAVLTVSLWSSSANAMNMVFADLTNHWWERNPEFQWFWRAWQLQVIVALLFRTVPLFVLAVCFLRGGSQMLARLAFLFQSRSRFVMTAGGWLALNQSFQLVRWLAEYKNHNPLNGPILSIGMNTLLTLAWPLALIVLIAVFLPIHGQNPSIPARHVAN
jgi:hypothetical protein